MTVRRSTDKPAPAPPSVIAPWTKVVKKDVNTKTKQLPGTTAFALQTRSFVFADVAQLDFDYGAPMTPVDKEEHNLIEKQLKQRLCLRSAKKTVHAQATQKCKRKVQILKCVSCTEEDGTWYSAVSQSAAVFGKVVYYEDTIMKSVDSHNATSTSTSTFPKQSPTKATSMTLQFPNYNDGPFMYEQLDIGIPIAGQDEKLIKFAARLGPSIRQFRSGLFGAKIAIRLLVSRFPFDKPSPSDETALEKLRHNLTVATGLTEMGDSVVFVPVGMDDNLQEFSRAKAINALHRVTHHDDRSVFAGIDVDLAVGPKFLRNAMTFPFPQTAAYFPIMWSQYNPETVDLVDEFMPKLKKSKFSEHHGHWRKFSFGMYVIAGSDAANLAMDETFVGWGGEDNDFFAKAKEKLNIVRLHETGLTHVWHPKHCSLGGFVKDKYFRDCVASMAHFEGSQLGMYLKDLKDHDITQLDQIMIAAREKGSNEKGGATAMDMEAQQAGEEEKESPTILVGVISSRDNFATRVKGIVETWGDPLNVPEGTTMRFFVGAAPESNEFFGKPEEDAANLAALAGIKDLSTIVVMDGVVDNEYPPVRKNSAMIENLSKIAESFESDPAAPTTFQWIYKVDDDAYVNFDGLLSFIKTRNSDSYSMYGEQGTGRAEDRDGLKKAGLVKPYCTGGPGYIMSRKTVKDTASHMQECVAIADKSDYRQYLWHSDSVIGLCIYNHTGAGCWDDKDYYQNRIFRHNLNKEDPFLTTSQLSKTIACHPFKDQASLNKQHMRYVQIAK
ncbi:MAG: hypothetical protein SGILL_007930, partial [Bacillariaceae sp.]